MTFITSYQLFEFAKASNIASSLGSFYWRIGRLVECGLVQTVMLQIGKYRIYTITRQGLRELENRQPRLLSLTSGRGSSRNGIEIPHALLLNDIRRTFEQQFQVEWWRTDLLVRAANLSARRYAKDYDAVFSLDRSSAGAHSLTIAVEYERTLKAEDRYAEISNTLSGENSIDLLFYLCASADMVPLLAQRIRPEKPRSRASRSVLSIRASTVLCSSGPSRSCNQFPSVERHQRFQVKSCDR